METRDKILAAKDIQSETLEIPEWDVTIEIRGITGAQRGRILNNAVDNKGTVDFTKLYPELVIASVHDITTGEPVFTDADRDVLSKKSGAVLERIADVANRLSGLTADSVTLAKKN